MNYDDMLNRSDEEAADRLLATKILDLMDKLRLSKNHQAAKRWIWELLQNAKDVSYEDSGVSVAIDLISQGQNSRRLIFRHNGQPFNAKTITFLIRQVSTKDRKQKEGEKKTTGKFGTGFLSTHLLSEKVLVKGIVKDNDLPYQKFNLTLDRSPTELDEVVISVEKTLKEIRKFLSPSQPSVSFDRSHFNTSFEYELQPEKVDLARAGIADLHDSLPFTLAFSTEIRSVTISHENITYRILGSPHSLTKKMELVTIAEDKVGEKPKTSPIVVVRGQKAAIAVQLEFDDDALLTRIKKFRKEQPKLFCDFPLIGSHDFPFPVVINSPSFNPNEPRSTVWLTDVDDPRVRENEEIMKEALGLYKELLSYASSKGWVDLFNLINFSPTIESEWLSADWFNENVIHPLHQYILNTQLVDNPIVGRISMQSEDGFSLVNFPSSVTAEIREKLWDLAQVWVPDTLPARNEVHEWYAVIWPDCTNLSLEVIAEFIQKSEDLSTLQEALHRDEKSTMRWLNYFYNAANLDTAFRLKIINDEYKVIPNQNGIFQTRSYLKIGKEIDEALKDVLKILNIDLRDSLKKSDAFSGNEIKYVVYNQQQAIDQINTSLQNSKIASQLRFDACDLIMTLFSNDNTFPTNRRNTIYEFSRRLYPNTVSEKRQLEHYHPDIFKEADKIQIRAIVQNVAEKKNINDLTARLKFYHSTDTLRWLHHFVDFLVKNDFESQLELKSHPILPNQNGEFTIKDNLYLDDGEISEELKNIAASLGSDFRGRLLDKTIFLKLPETRVISSLHVADEITRLIIPRMAEIPRKEETKTIFKQVYQYFIKNPDDASLLFKDIYVNKHKLFDDEEIAASIEKIAEVEQLLKEFSIDDIDGLKNLLRQAAQNTARVRQDDEPVSKELLAALGITSEEQLKRLIGEDPSSSIFRHVSSATPEMYLYANTIIARARRNVVAHLKTLPEYIVDDNLLDDLAPTVIGGIRKEGLPIHIVFRPSDNGQVLFYYPSEKATLDLANAELWIDDGITTPSHLTLGRILTTTGINRIPIK